MRGHVVGPHGRAAVPLPAVRVALALEQGLGESAGRLLHPHDVGARGEPPAARGERAAGTIDLHPARAQHAKEPGHRQRVRRLRGEGERGGRLARRGAAVHPQEGAQPVLPIPRRLVQHREGGRELVVHDVAEAPGAPRPGGGEVPGGGPRVVAEAGLKLPGGEDEGRGQLRGSGLGQDADPAVGVRVGASGGPGVEDRLGHDPGLPLGHQPGLDRAAQRPRGRAQRRVHVGLPRIEVGREEEPRSPRSHLVHVVDDLGPPTVVKVAHREQGLRLREHVPVAVVVVAGVLLVEGRGRGRREGAPRVAALPGGHEVGPVRVVGGNEEHHRLLEDARDLRVRARRQPVSEHERREGGAHLGRVDRVVHGDDRLAAAQDPLRLVVRKPAGIPEAQVVAADLLEARLVRGRGDGDHQERAALGRAPDVVGADAGRGRGQAPKVLGDLRPVGELAVIAGAKAEHALRRGDGVRPLGQRAQGAGDETGGCQEQEGATFVHRPPTLT